MKPNESKLHQNEVKLKKMKPNEANEAKRSKIEAKFKQNGSEPKEMEAK